MYEFREPKQIPCSRESTEKCYHCFVNLTTRTVDVIWINYDGERIPYKTLSAGEYVDVNTFKNHPWIAMDHSTNEWLALGGKPVYFPVTFKELFESKLKRRSYSTLLLTADSVRTQVSITSPLYSLRRNCLNAVIKNLKDCEDIERLDLPLSLIKDLRVLSKK